MFKQRLAPGLLHKGCPGVKHKVSPGVKHEVSNGVRIHCLIRCPESWDSFLAIPIKIPKLYDQKRSGLRNGPDCRRNKKKQEEIASWDDEKIRLQEARRKRGIFDVSSEDAAYFKVISDSRAKLERCVAAAMSHSQR